MVEIDFYLGLNPYMLAIGKSFKREDRDDLIFSLVENEKNFKGDFIVVLDCESSGLNFKKKIIVTEDKNKEGIFLYQKKDSLLASIIALVKGDDWKANGLDVLGGFSFDCAGMASYFNYFISSILGSFKKKVCFISFNPFFPYEKAYPVSQKGGLSKLLHYLECNEGVEPSLLSYHHHYDF